MVALLKSTEESAAVPALGDYRGETAQRKRDAMRHRIFEATIRVFARRGEDAPVIEDVVREAGIARATFYRHFRTLDDALVAAGINENEQMTANILPLYDCLKEPWQRVAVGFRTMLVRAWQDPKWAAFCTRLDAWPQDMAGAQHMANDLRRGLSAGQFHFADVQCVTDFSIGAMAGTIHALRRGVDDPHGYMDAAVRLMFQTLGSTPELGEKAAAFSRHHLDSWIRGELIAWQPL